MNSGEKQSFQYSRFIIYTYHSVAYYCSSPPACLMSRPHLVVANVFLLWLTEQCVQRVSLMRISLPDGKTGLPAYSCVIIFEPPHLYLLKKDSPVVLNDSSIHVVVREEG